MGAEIIMPDGKVINVRPPQPPYEIITHGSIILITPTQEGFRRRIKIINESKKSSELQEYTHGSNMESFVVDGILVRTTYTSPNDP